MKKQNWIERNKKTWCKVALSAAAALFSADALAAPGDNGVYTIKISPGISRRQTLKTLPDGRVQARQNLGAGNEHARVETVGNTIVMVYVSNNVANQNGPSQLKCTSLTMTPNAAPTINAGADQVALTWTNADRFGHPSLSCETTGANAGKCLFAYGANNVNGNGNTQTYAGVIDAATCKDLTGFKNHVRLNADANNNEAAPMSVFDGTKHVFGYYSNNNATYAELVSIVPDGNGGLKPKQLTKPQKLINANQGRPAIALAGPNRAVIAAAAGQNRPAPNGIQAVLLNTDTAAITNNQMPQLWKKTLVQAQPDKNNVGGVDGLPGPLGGRGVYPARPQLVTGANGLLHLVSFISDGAGHNRNKKGSSTNHILTFKPDDTGPNPLGQTAGAMLESNHLGACISKVGTVGSEQVVTAVPASSPTGFGAASLTFMKESGTTAAPAGSTTPFHTMVGSAAVSSGNADGAYLSNMLGRNPGTQGGNFATCLGDVANPGYGVASGFMPTTKSFILAPYAGRVTTPGTPAANAPQVLSAEGKMLPEDRNALFLTMVSAVRDPAAPAPPSVTPPAPGTSPGIPGVPGSAGTPGDPGNAGTPGTPGTSGTPGSGGHFSSGCSVAFGAVESSGFAGLLFMVALGFVIRRRWS